MEAIKAFDPRDPDQREDRPETWKETTNPALMVANTLAEGLKGSGKKLDWKRVASQANRCDALVPTPTYPDPLPDPEPEPEFADENPEAQ